MLDSMLDAAPARAGATCSLSDGGVAASEAVEGEPGEAGLGERLNSPFARANSDRLDGSASCGSDMRHTTWRGKCARAAVPSGYGYEMHKLAVWSEAVPKPACACVAGSDSVITASLSNIQVRSSLWVLGCFGPP